MFFFFDYFPISYQIIWISPYVIFLNQSKDWFGSIRISGNAKAASVRNTPVVQPISKLYRKLLRTAKTFLGNLASYWNYALSWFGVRAGVDFRIGENSPFLLGYCWQKIAYFAKKYLFWNPDTNCTESFVQSKIDGLFQMIINRGNFGMVLNKYVIQLVHACLQSIYAYAFLTTSCGHVWMTSGRCAASTPYYATISWLFSHISYRQSIRSALYKSI